MTSSEESPRPKVTKRTLILACLAALVGAVVIPSALVWWDGRTPNTENLPFWIAGYQTEQGLLTLDVVLTLCPDDQIHSYEKTGEDEDQVEIYLRLTGATAHKCDDRELSILTFKLDEPLGNRRVTDGGSLEIPPYDEP